jgi:dipeptidyl aminopeptidase/acylaminoacyl peptidase
MDRTRRAGMAGMISALGLAFGSDHARSAPPLEAYGRLPATELVRISPSGERIALIMVTGETRKLIIMTPAGMPLKAEAVGDAKVRDLEWAGDDHLLVTKTATVDLPLDFEQSYELAAVLHVGLNEDKIWAVFQHSPGIVATVVGSYGSALQGGRWFGYFGGITMERSADTYHFSHDYADLYRLDLQTGETHLKAKGSERQHDWVLAADGTIVAHSEYDEKSGAWSLFAGPHDSSLLLKKSAPLGDIELQGAGRTPGTVLLLDETGDSDDFEEIATADGKTQIVFADQRILYPLFDPDTHLLIGATMSEEPGTILFDPILQARTNAWRKAFPDVQVHLISYDTKFQRIMFYTDGGHDSGAYYLIDVAAHKVDLFGYAYPDIKPSDVGATQMVPYRAADRLAMEGVLTLPAGRAAKKLPLVVFPHGGPIGIWDRIGFDWWAQAFASRGYAVFQPNYRGSGGYTVKFQRAGFGQWGRKMQSDISDGVAELAKQGIVDPSRACIMGGSYGGYAALAGVTLQQGLYRCAVSVAGPADMRSFRSWEMRRNGDQSASSRYWRHVTGADTDGEGVLKAISPALHAESADAPILLIHGKDDTRVPIEQSEEMAAALKHAGKLFQFVELPHEDHFLSREATRIAMLKAAVAFVEKYNPP